MKILTNYDYNQENISLNMQIQIINLYYPSIISIKSYKFIIYFNKLDLLIYSNIYFLKIYQTMLLNDHISIYNHNHNCLNNQTKELKLIDSTYTFDIDENLNLILKKYLNVKQKNIYNLILEQQQQKKNSTTKVS